MFFKCLNKDMRSFRSFLKEETDPVEVYLREFGDAVAQTHQRVDFNNHTLFKPLNFDSNLPNKLLMSCLQGDEPAGWAALLEYVKNNKPEAANVSYIPIMSKEVFRSGNHEDDMGINPNQRIPYKPSREAVRLLAAQNVWLPLASGGFLDLHEDPYRDFGYMYVWSDTGDLGQRLIDIIGDKFPLLHGPDEFKAIEGRIEEDEQGMLGDYLASLGVSPCMTTETPAHGGYALSERVGVQVELIKEFIND